ncbi:MAG: penicillin-binding protein 2 [Candidatus Limnocylindrales bacterium]
MLGRTDSRLRMVAILVAFAVIGVAASARLGYWQVVASDELTAQIVEVKQQAAQQAVHVTRADIVDRNGNVLAKTSSFDRLVAYPDIIDAEDLESDVDLLVALLDLSDRQRLEYLEKLEEGIESGSQFMTLDRRLSFEQSEAVEGAMREKLLPGYGLTPADVRNYPLKGGEPGTTLASHILGFVRGDDRGGEGVERYYDERLTTVDPGQVDVAIVGGAPMTVSAPEPEPLQLTIDARLQRQVEKDLHAIKTANRAKTVSAIVMDPHTGAILAAASVPAYDAEDYAAIASDDIGILVNRVFQHAYEPGSVMKIFTATAALDLGLVTPNTIIEDQKRLRFWEYDVENADLKSKGALKVKDVVALSRNVATAKIARMLAPNDTQKAARRLFGLWRKVGLSGRTGVDISGEAKGLWYDPRDYLWAPVDLANRAFGQGISVTLPQLARGISTIVNGGYKIQPHFAVEGEAARVDPERVLKAKTARQAKDILRQVTGAVPWYAEGALIPGYDIGGKTGTAQIWNTKKGQWKKKRFNHSFIGFVGGRKQEYVIAVRLEEPIPVEIEQGNIPLRIESYEAFQTIARTTIDKLKMKRSKDPLAGRPIPGTDAARRLAPAWNREILRSLRNQRATDKGPTTRKAAARNGSKASALGSTTGGPAQADRGT